MAPDPKSGLIWAAFAASAGVHAATAFTIAAFPTSGLHSLAPSSEIEVVVVAPEPPPELPPPPPEPMPRALEPVDGTRHLVPDSVPVLPREPAPREDEREETPPTPSEEPPAHEEMRPLVSLDPRSVAAGSFVFDPGTPRAPTRAPSTTDSDEDVLEGALDGALGRAANARPYVSRRPPPHLRQRTDGSYVFSGPRFGAVIHPDGTVAFADRSNAAVNGPSLERENGLTINGTFDVTDAIEAARGGDPLRAERDWFMRETAELREELEARAAARESHSGAASARGRARRIWDGSGTAVARRRQLFELWDECSDDEMGAAARRAVEQTIRAVCPSGSPDAYTPAELARFNARRVSRDPFAPYEAP